jgi:hypothetical protein
LHEEDDGQGGGRHHGPVLEAHVSYDESACVDSECNKGHCELLAMGTQKVWTMRTSYDRRTD